VSLPPRLCIELTIRNPAAAQALHSRRRWESKRKARSDDTIKQFTPDKAIRGHSPKLVPDEVV